jgi:signal transduction histidine kinase
LLTNSAATTLQRHHLEAGTIQLMRFDANGPPALVLGNPEDLQTAILNVLDNAVKYAQAKVDIQIRLNGADSTWIRFSIADQGMGIPAGQLKRIFLRFYRVPNRNLLHVKGTGLGLFLVRNIVQQHGGEVYAESAGEGRGTTIHFQLPRALPATSDAAAAARASLPA